MNVHMIIIQWVCHSIRFGRLLSLSSIIFAITVLFLGIEVILVGMIQVDFIDGPFCFVFLSVYKIIYQRNKCLATVQLSIIGDIHIFPSNNLFSLSEFENTLIFVN